MTYHYRHIPEGKGGIFSIPYVIGAAGDQTELHQIGTHGCITCVGVYFPIDKDRCFCAHINASIRRNGAGKPSRSVYNEREEDEIQRLVEDRLRLAFRDANVDLGTFEVDASRVVMVCPQPIDEREQEQTGIYIINTVKQLLRLPAEYDVDTQSEGFIVNHQTGNVLKLADGGKDNWPLLKPETGGDMGNWEVCAQFNKW